jgi:hypothetical protein
VAIGDCYQRPTSYCALGMITLIPHFQRLLVHLMSWLLGKRTILFQ